MAASYELALAIALDTVEVALRVTAVTVVTSRSAGAAFSALGARIVHDPGGGLNSAIVAGLGTLDGPAGVLLGDLPALTAAELDEALKLAGDHARAFVADSEGVGTTLITALAGFGHRPAFGIASRAAHVAAGYTELVLPVNSGLRRDVDTVSQLSQLSQLSVVGPRTQAVFSAGL